MDDIISRQAAIDAFRKELCRERVYATPFISFKGCERILNELPSAERLGRWEDIEHAPNGLLYATCSVCGKRQTIEATDYCGNCGARMEEEA